MKNYYNVLHIPQDASVAEIEKAYKKLAKQYDPNRARGDKYAEERFIDVSLAYKTLTDNEKREDYDRVLKSIVRGVGRQHSAGAAITVVQPKVTFRWVGIMAVLVVVVCGSYWMFNSSQKKALFISAADKTAKSQNVPVQTVRPAQDTIKEVVVPIAKPLSDKKPVVAPEKIVKEVSVKKKDIPPKAAVIEEKERPVTQPAEAVQDNYTIGASKSTILNIQGTPTAIAKYNAETDVWFYGKSELHISKGKLMVVKNIDGNLKVK